MNEIKFSYNPFTKEFIKSSFNFHCADLRGKNFKEFIRGCIIDNTLYLRAFYPYEQEDIKEFSLLQLYKVSDKILRQYIKDLIKVVKKELNIYIIESRIVFNADKDLKINNVS